MAQLPSSYVMQTNDNDLGFTCFVLSVHDTLYICVQCLPQYSIFSLSDFHTPIAFRFDEFPLFISPAGISQINPAFDLQHRRKWFKASCRRHCRHRHHTHVHFKIVQTLAELWSFLVCTAFFTSSQALFLITPTTSNFRIVYVKWNFNVLSEICAVSVYVGEKNATTPAASATKTPTSHIVDSEQLPLLPSSAYLQFFDFCSILHKIYAHNIEQQRQH